MPPRPILGSDAQLLAERAVLRLLRDADVIALMDAAKAELAAMPRGQTQAGAERIEQVVQQWTAALILDELSYVRRANPAFTQGTDTTPRRWLGHWFPGNGKAGDNPDMLSRSCVIDGCGQYEVLGQIDPARPPVQIVTTMFAGTMTHPAPDTDELRATVLADLPGYLRFWASYPDKWLGGIAPGGLVAPVSREGGWGFMAAHNIALAPGEAAVATLSPGAAAYMAYQFTDPWLNGPEPGRRQTSLNLAQAAPDPACLLHQCRIVKLAEIAELPGLARITPEGRAQQLAQRRASHASRLTAA